MTDTPGAAVRRVAQRCRAAQRCLGSCRPNPYDAGLAMRPLQSGGWKLWIKRRDVEEADYSAVDGLSPELTVDELKRRWVADKKLDLDSSLVKLYRVKDSPGKPTDTEDLAALIKERLLHDPSLTLFDAGVRDRCWLLAEFVQVTGAHLVLFLRPLCIRMCTVD